MPKAIVGKGADRHWHQVVESRGFGGGTGRMHEWPAYCVRRRTVDAHTSRSAHCAFKPACLQMWHHDAQTDCRRQYNQWASRSGRMLSKNVFAASRTDDHDARCSRARQQRTRTHRPQSVVGREHASADPPARRVFAQCSQAARLATASQYALMQPDCEHVFAWLPRRESRETA